MDDELEDFLKISWNICLTKKPSFNKQLKEDAESKHGAPKLKSVAKCKTNASKRIETESKTNISIRNETEIKTTASKQNEPESHDQPQSRTVRRKLFYSKDEEEDSPLKKLVLFKSPVKSNGSLKKIPSFPKELIPNRKRTSPLQNKFISVPVSDKLPNESDFNVYKKVDAAKHGDLVIGDNWNISLSGVSDYNKNVVEKEAKEFFGDAEKLKKPGKEAENIIYLETKETLNKRKRGKSQELNKEVENIEVVSNLETKVNPDKRRKTEGLSNMHIEKFEDSEKEVETQENFNKRKQKKTKELSNLCTEKLKNFEKEAEILNNSETKENLKKQKQRRSQRLIIIKELENIEVVNNLETKGNPKKRKPKKTQVLSDLCKKEENIDVLSNFETKKNPINRKRRKSKGFSKERLNNSNRKKLNKRLNADLLLDDSESSENVFPSGGLQLNSSKPLKSMDNFKAVSEIENDGRIKDTTLDNLKNAYEQSKEKIFTPNELSESLKLCEFSEPVDVIPSASKVNASFKSVELPIGRSTRRSLKNKNDEIVEVQNSSKTVKDTKGIEKINAKKVHSESLTNTSKQSKNSKVNRQNIKNVLKYSKEVDGIENKDVNTSKYLGRKLNLSESSVLTSKTDTSLPNKAAQENRRRSERLKTGSNVKEQLSSKILVYDNDLHQDVVLDCVQRQQSYSFDVAKNETVSIAKILRHEKFATGIMKLRPREEKGYRFTSGDTLAFWISRGTLEVTIHETTVKLFENDSFYVPAGNGYNVVNLSDYEASLVFFQLKSYTV